MNRKKSILLLAFIGIFIILMAVFAVLPTFQIGKTVYDYTGYARTIKLGLDMSGGISAVYEVQQDDLGGDMDARVRGTIDSLQGLLVSKGYTEATVVEGTNSRGNTTITVEVPDIDDPERVLELVGRPAKLEFFGEDEAGGEPLIDGRKHLESAYVSTDQNSQFCVALKFNDAGTQKFAEVTTEYEGKDIYIYVDGERYTSVRIQSVISNGQAIISSDSGYTYNQAYEFATQLQAGTFGVTLKQTEIRNISPVLGENAVRVALIAGIVGVALIFIFLIIAYRGLGIAADLALCVYVVLLIWFCAVLPWVQLTLPGVAGILLSIGMAVDANVVIFERIKDEYRHTSKPIPTAIKDGFKRSTAAIIDGNVTTLIGAVVLWILGSASIVGFAVTLFIGIILSMFTSLVVTRLLLKCFIPFNSKSERFYGLKREKDDVSEKSKVAANAAEQGA